MLPKKLKHIFQWGKSTPSPINSLNNFKMDNQFARLLAQSADELFEMLPPHKGKRQIGFKAKLEKGWADMIWFEIYGEKYPEYGPRYIHSSVVKGCRWYSNENIAIFHFEGNRSNVEFDKYRNTYNSTTCWGTITVMITKNFEIKIDIMKDFPPIDLQWHKRMYGYKEITQEEIDTEVAELVGYVEVWFQDVLRKHYQRRIQAMKQDIAATVWHPKRVAKWVEAGVALEDL